MQLATVVTTKIIVEMMSRNSVSDPGYSFGMRSVVSGRGQAQEKVSL